VKNSFLKDFLANGYNNVVPLREGEINVALWDTVMYSFAGRTVEEVLPNRERIMAGGLGLYTQLLNFILYKSNFFK
jgi:hypothetical protein